MLQFVEILFLDVRVEVMRLVIMGVRIEVIIAIIRSVTVISMSEKPPPLRGVGLFESYCLVW